MPPFQSFTYDPTEHGFLAVSFHYYHTVLPHVLLFPGFWFFLICHVSWWILLKWKIIEEYFPETAEGFKPGGVYYVDVSQMKAIIAYTTFFQVFYTSHCYTRYFQLCQLVNHVFRSAHRAVFDLKVYIAPTPDGQQYLRVITRWMRVIILIFFIQLRHGPIEAWHFEYFVAQGVLRPEERTFLEELPAAQRSLVLLHWMCRLTVVAYQLQPAGPPILNGLVARFTFFDESMRQVLDVVRMPVPFQYFHLIHVMVCINVSLWSFHMAFDQSIFTPIIFCFVSLIIIGMLDLAKTLSDPFGDNDMHFPLDLWFEKFLETHLAFLEYNYPGLDQDFQSVVDQETASKLQASTVSVLIGDDFSFVAEENNGGDTMSTSPRSNHALLNTSEAGIPSVDRGRLPSGFEHANKRSSHCHTLTAP